MACMQGSFNPQWRRRVGESISLSKQEPTEAREGNVVYRHHSHAGKEKKILPFLTTARDRDPRYHSTLGVWGVCKETYFSPFSCSMCSRFLSTVCYFSLLMERPNCEERPAAAAAADNVPKREIKETWMIFPVCSPSLVPY